VTIKTKPKRKRKNTDKLSTSSKAYQKALDLAEAGKNKEALEYIQKYLNSSPNNAESLNDAGAILHCMNRSDEAIKHLLKARSLQPDSAEIIWNLSETYLTVGKAEQAIELFDDMEKMGILNAEILNRTAEILINAGKLSDAVKMLNRSLKLSPNQKILKPMIEIINSKMLVN
jgi:tetratricopeptide (TPR) repeat protein